MCAGCRRDALIGVAFEVAWAVACVFAGGWRIAGDTDVHTLVTDLSAGTRAAGVAREEAHSRETGLVRSTVSIDRAFEVWVRGAECVVTDMSGDAFGVFFARRGAVSVEA